MPIDWSSGEAAEGLACYRRAEFFSAHEHWEVIWLKLKEPEKSFLQALIQVAAAFHHQQTKNFVGTVSLLRLALGRLERSQSFSGGIAVAQLCAEIRVWLKAIESGEMLPAAFPEITPV